MRYTANDIIGAIEKCYPPFLAESWDNPGLLVGRGDRMVDSAVIALDCSRRTVERAVETGSQMIITHHPVIFDSLKAVNDGSFLGRKILRMIENGISCYAMHTNFDIARQGMAALAAERLGMKDCTPLEMTGEQDGVPVGIGFVGDLTSEMAFKARQLCPGTSDEKEAEGTAVSAAQLAAYCKEAFDLREVFFYDGGRPVRRIAVCPGSGRHMMEQVLSGGADAFITGDTGHHDGMDYYDEGLTLIDAGHYGIEKIYVRHMKHFLEQHFPDLKLYEEATDERQYVSDRV